MEKLRAKYASKVKSLEADVQDVENELAAELDIRREEWAPAAMEIEPLVVPPRKSDITVRLLSLGWTRN